MMTTRKRKINTLSCEEYTSEANTIIRSPHNVDIDQTDNGRDETVRSRLIKPPKRKKVSVKNEDDVMTMVTPWAKGFNSPSPESILAAEGRYPMIDHYTSGRLRRKIANGRPKLILDSGGKIDSISQIDQQYLYQGNDEEGKAFWHPLPHPKDEYSWLANYAEPGQDFHDYALYVTCNRESFNKIPVQQSTIYLFPINDSKSSDQWPAHGPPLDKLAKWINLYYNRTVKVLPTAYLYQNKASKSIKSKITFEIGSKVYHIAGRTHEDRFQSNVLSILDILLPMVNCKELPFAEPFHHIPDCIAIVAVTMTDLYSAEKDLFIAGMASSCKASIQSFFRYNSYLKTDITDWYDYGYVTSLPKQRKFDPHLPESLHKRKKLKLQDCPTSIDSAADKEFLRKSGMLLLHEIGHIFGLEHCIYYKCLMNGSGNLEEDYSSTSSLCGICLRKMQYRLGFNVVERYEKLHQFYKDNGLDEEMEYSKRRLEHIRDHHED